MKIFDTVNKKTYYSPFKFFKFLIELVGFHFYTFNLLNFFVVLLDGIGIFLFIPLLEITLKSNNVTSNKLSFITTFFDATNIPMNLITLLSLMLIVFGLKACVAYIRDLYFIRLKLIAIKSIRFNLVNNFKTLSYRGFTKVSPGKIQFSMVGETTRLVNAFINFNQTITQITIILTYIGLALFADWQFALLVVLGGALSNLIYRFINKATQKEAEKISTIGTRFNKYLIESIQNFKYLKATNTFPRYEKKLKKSIHEFEETQFKIGKLNAILSNLREPLTILILAIILIIHNYYLKNDAKEAILVNLFLFYRALSSLVNMQSSWNVYLGNVGALHSIDSLVKIFKNNKETLSPSSSSYRINSIQVKNVSLAYEYHNILTKISLEIAPKQTVALVGESGAGKSSLANIIGGLIKSTEGSLLINDEPFNPEKLGSYRDRIGYISQDPIIFNDTVFNNVTFWDTKNEKNLAKFNECMELVHLQSFLDKSLLKEDTQLGNNGNLISGGQKQRISIARELYKDVDLLILDEATSALDSETERIIKENITNLKGQYMMLIIAHRLSTIKHADLIYLLNNGQIVSKGSFSELYKNSSKFKTMVDLQET